MKTIHEESEVPVKGKYDVIVAGAGVAGISAAIEVARHHRTVLIIEKSLTMGGLATLGLINFFVPMCNGRGKQIVKGMCEELLRDSIRYGYDSIPRDWKNGEPQEETRQRYMTWYSADIFALVLADKLTREGVDILLDSVVVKPVMEGRICLGVIVENKTGRVFYEAGSVIDATGDADILFRAGVPTVTGKNYFTYSGKAIDMKHIRTALETGNIADAFYQVHGGNANLYGGDQMPGMRLFEGVTAEDVTEYILTHQKILLEEIKAQERWSRDIVQLPGMAQFRTTRRIDGDVTLTEEDVYRHFDSSVCAINDFDHIDALYEVPYGSLVKRGFPNLITCGRSVSASGWAWDVTRVIPPAILTGQAAGLACAMRAGSGCALSDVDVASMQQMLAVEDVMIHFDDDLVPENRTVIHAPTYGHL